MHEQTRRFARIQQQQMLYAVSTKHGQLKQPLAALQSEQKFCGGGKACLRCRARARASVAVVRVAQPPAWLATHEEEAHVEPDARALAEVEDDERLGPTDVPVLRLTMS